jgi:hypothetical protein
MALKTLREALAEIEEFEKRKHVTHVGFVLMTVYRDEKPIKKVMARPEYDKQLCEEVFKLAEQYRQALV